LSLFFIKPDVFFIIEKPKFFIMHNTKCFYIGLLCLFFTSNIFSQTTIQGKILDEQGESLLGANVIINGIRDILEM
tara:strand:+ start:435 stop:662 length:228 start_codon:yes stop_codon:yes gene_type:complete